ncbi:hypothetical protein QR680_012856 [Steinernema hermaphroditum]|uniref:Structural maintenance of chromosomes protein n=1 Tax=Steinernema hermaphroditum TaxID=289476 RepID=A0AA39M0K7_9BILA|nr:hypothetical protein QR680_012856 [Steinernema hermaphroditum]
MGFLRTLGICNFKSYRGEHSFGPFDETKILSILGQNGEGKSNFTDAIAFVFGDKSGSLRARHLRDLCFGGITRDGAVSSNCYVSATCCVSVNEVVVFKRAIVSQGRSCQFSIDGSPVSQKEYLERLCHLGIDGWSQNFIVQQGAVDKMGIMNNIQRTEYFEKVSKSLEFKKDYDELLKNRSEEQSKLTELSMKHGAARRDMLRFKAELRAREQHDKEVQNSEALSIRIRLMEMHDIQRQLQNCDERLTALRDAKNERRIRMGNVKDKDHINVEKNYEHMLKRIKGDISKKMKTKAEIEKRVLTFLQENDMRQQHLNILRRRIGGREQKRERLLEAKSLLNKNLDESRNKSKMLVEIEEVFPADQIAKYNEIKLSLSGGLLGIRIQELEAKKMLLGQTVGRSAITAASIKKHIESYDKKRRDLEVTRVQRENAAAEVANELAELQKEKDEVSRMHKAMTAKKDQLEAMKIIYTAETVDPMKALSAQHKQSKDVVQKLKSRFGSQSVFGRVYELMKPYDFKHMCAFDAAVGDHLNWIVVSNNRVARECSVFLLNNAMSQEVFLPLNKFKMSSQRSLYASDERLYRTLGGCFDIQSEIFYPISSYITEGIALCEDAAEAEHLMSTVEQLDKAVDYLPRRPDWERKLSEVCEEIERYNIEEGKTSEVMYELKQHQVSIRKDVENIINRAVIVEERATTLQKEFDEIENEHQLLIQQSSDNQNQIKSLRDKQNKAAENVFEEFCDKLGIADIGKYEDTRKKIETIRKDLEDLETSTRKLNVEIGLLEGDIASEEKNAADNDAASCQFLEDEVTRYAEIIRSNSAEMNGIDESISKLKEELSTNERRKAEELKQCRRENYNRKNKVEQELADVVKQINATNRDKERFLLLRHDLLNKAARSKLQLPFVSNSESTEHDDQEGRRSGMFNYSLPVLAEERRRRLRAEADAFQLDFRSLPKHYVEATNDATRQGLLNEEKAKLKTSMNKLQKLKVLNSNCQSELEVAQRQLEDLTDHMKAVKARIQSIDGEFVRVQEQRKQRFEDFFNRVNENVLSLYRIVTADESAYAQLTLEDVNEPFAAGIQYACVLPSKTATMFEMMSSGEQSLAALALSLAVHSTLETPLLVLDEVDAALDMRNTDRVYSFLRSTIAKGVQVFVVSHRFEFLYRAEHVLGLYAIEDDADDDDAVEQIRRSTRALSFDATIFPDNDDRAPLSESTIASPNREWSQVSF